MKRIVNVLLYAACAMIAVVVLKEDVYAETYTDKVTSMEFIKISDGLYMGKYEVTNAQFRKFKPDHNSREIQKISLNTDNQPVVYVSFNEAEEFAKWLSDKTGMKYRLPTDKEWESACKAGREEAIFWKKSEDICLYANLSDEERWSKMASNIEKGRFDMAKCNDGFAVTAPVGSKTPNDFGLFDMLGNVWEWTSAKYGGNDGRTIRGGAWTSLPEKVTCTTFRGRLPGTWDADIGFRLVLEKKP